MESGTELNKGDRLLAWGDRLPACLGQRASSLLKTRREGERPREPRRKRLSRTHALPSSGFMRGLGTPLLPRCFAVQSILILAGAMFLVGASYAEEGRTQGTASLPQTPGTSSPPYLRTQSLIESLSDADVQESISLLKANYLNPDALSEPEIQRATLAGIIARIAPGASVLQTQTTETAPSVPVYSEILDSRIGYLRLGTFSKAMVDEMDAALKKLAGSALKFLVLDLRATPPSYDFNSAAEIAKRFCPKGELLFSIKKPGAKLERIFTSNRVPQFEGVLVVLVDREAAGAPEVVAAVLRGQARGLIIGETTMGQAVDYVDLPLHNGKVLRVAESVVLLPGNKPIFPQGVKPDLVVKMLPGEKNEIFKQSLEKGIGGFVFDKERPKMNEAALVAGINPELDALAAAQGKPTDPKVELRDPVLQRAVDFITTIKFYGADRK